MPTACALETMGGCFLALLKFTGPSAQRNFPKFATKEDRLFEISADSIRNKITGGRGSEGGCIVAEHNLDINQELPPESVDWFASWEPKKCVCISSKDPNKRLRI
ncbi:hypothetical protein AMTRI_Chr10g227210 [Amborella trichopoda]